MNWRFGYSLGTTEFDGLIYGAASAAADCLKALIPFFLFAAIRNRMWSQAAAAAVVGVVVTAYSLTSALGHAALNRLDTTGQRAQQTAVYQDMRSDVKRMEEQVGWIPKHRPAATVASEMNGLKNQIYWSRTQGCTVVNGKFNRDFCQQYHTLSAEHANAVQAADLSKKIMEVKAQLAKSGDSHTALTEADPQAAMLAKIGGLVFPDLKVDDVQMALTIFIALLLEVGSGFGMYIAFSQWRLHDALHNPKVASAAAVGQAAVAMPLDVVVQVPVATPVAAQTIAIPAIAAAAPAAVPATPAVQAIPAAPPAPAVITPPAATANDNTDRIVHQPQRLVAPEGDAERFHRERVETEDGSTITATDLYEHYCVWCEEQDKEPLALPTFSKNFSELKDIRREQTGRKRFIGISIREATEIAEDKKPPIAITRAA
ncbi:hypothetical protein [Hyphomicrobium sp. CS1BSMeth3]|uniref:hypothetical protein n=1 Tax=Hyphomicrobium sp. CS1BSMeth3 TaxID=1892844 RepID=UPI00116015D0|nr:hypothetical protein [Hyphomicrobium sp. CS1BSMeth3]